VTARQDLNSGLVVRGTLELDTYIAPVPGGARTRTVPTSWLGWAVRYRRTAAAAERHTPARAAMGRPKACVGWSTINAKPACVMSIGQRWGFLQSHHFRGRCQRAGADRVPGGYAPTGYCATPGTL
jgi:hypothetical protein